MKPPRGGWGGRRKSGQPCCQVQKNRVDPSAEGNIEQHRVNDKCCAQVSFRIACVVKKRIAVRLTLERKERMSEQCEQLNSKTSKKVKKKSKILSLLWDLAK